MTGRLAVPPAGIPRPPRRAQYSSTCDERPFAVWLKFGVIGIPPLLPWAHRMSPASFRRNGNNGRRDYQRRTEVPAMTVLFQMPILAVEKRHALNAGPSMNQCQMERIVEVVDSRVR